MIKIEPNFFLDVMEALREIENDFSQIFETNNDAIVSDSDCERLRNLLFVTENLCNLLNLKSFKSDEVVVLIAKVKVRLSGKSRDPYGKSYQGFYNDIKRVRESIKHYLKTKVFLYLPTENALYYNQEDLFGIREKFPKANKEIYAAGNCYATGNYTACVFHLMRAVEIGGKALVSFMKATKHLTKVKGGAKHKPISLCTWGELRSAMQLALDEQKKSGLTTEKKKRVYQFCNDAVEAFGHFQNAWRDKVSHSNVVYEKYDADKIMNSTERLMKHLSLRMKATK